SNVVSGLSHVRGIFRSDCGRSRIIGSPTSEVRLTKGPASGAVFAARRSSMRRVLIASTLLWAASFIVISGQARPHPALIRNRAALAASPAAVSDPVARLNAKLASGEVTLTSNGPSGYLQSVLTALDVPVSSQMLVFSKTSFQAPRIGPGNPRAIFFND